MRKKIISILFVFFLFILIGSMFRTMLGNDTFMTSKEMLLYIKQHNILQDPRKFISDTLDIFSIFDKISVYKPKPFSNAEGVIDFLRIMLDWIVYVGQFLVSSISALFNFLGSVFKQLFNVFKFLFDFLTYYMFGV